MTPDTRQKIQVFLVIAIALAAIRVAYVFYERRENNKPATANQAPPLNPDYYVVPKKLHPYDLKSAKQLTERPVWVIEGYRYTYYPYDPVRHRTNFKVEAGLLLPLQKLEIKDVITDITPGSSDQRQMMAVFPLFGKLYAFPIGSVQNGDYQIYSDDMLYIQDPRELYKHWPAETWAAIESHTVKPGMDEIQAGFAIGMGIPQRSSDPEIKTVKYPNGGKPVTITYRNGKAAEINNSPA